MKFSVYMSGRETEVASFNFQALAEEEARVWNQSTGRSTYVVDNSKSIHDAPVFQIKEA